MPLTVPEVRRLLYRLLVLRLPAAEVLSWSRWRRRHQSRAKRDHQRRRTPVSDG